MLPSKIVSPLLYQFVDLALKSAMVVIRKEFFLTKISNSYQNYQQRFQSSLEIDLGIYKGLQNYKFYPQFVGQSSDIDVNN